MNLIIKYSRGGAAKYISHLDMQRAFGRALRRAEIPVRYSEGFNPHIIMSFASPLSVGYATEGDYLEVGVLDGVDPHGAKDALNAALPPDIRVVSAFFAPDNKKKLMSLCHSAAYEIYFRFKNTRDYDRIKHALSVICVANEYIAENSKGKNIDIAPLILNCGCILDGVAVTLMNSGAASLNPGVFVRALFNEAGVQAEFEICRKECYAMIDGEIAPFSGLK